MDKSLKSSKVHFQTQIQQEELINSEDNQTKTNSQKENQNGPKNESDKDPLPRDSVSHILLKYFDHRWYHIHAKPTKKGEKIKWRTEKRYCLTQRNLWKDWLKEDKIIGLGFGNETKRILIDVDNLSPYHPDNDEEAYRKLRQTLEDLGLYTGTVVYSSYSTGIHLYYFLESEVSSYYASYCIQTALKAAGFEIKNGHLEVFPNMKAYSDNGKYTQFKAHRLPLQPGTGSCILSNFSLEYKGTSLAKFADMAEISAKENDVKHFNRMIQLCKESKPEFWENHRKRHKVSEWWTHLSDFIEEGWTDYGQTNILLGKIGQLCHVFEQKTGDDLVEAMVEKAKSLEGYSQYCRHQHEIGRRCRDWAKSVEKYYTILYEHPRRQETYDRMFRRTSAESPNKNKQKAQLASNRIKQAYDHIVATIETLPQKITEWIELLNETAKKLTGKGISKNTLFKEHNLCFWHPKHQKAKYDVVEDSNLDKESSSNSVNKRESDESHGGDIPNFVRSTEQVQKPILRKEKREDIKNSKKATENVVVQNKRQVESNGEGDCEEILTPDTVVCENGQKSERLETLSVDKSEQNSHTLPYMKCNLSPQSVWEPARQEAGSPDQSFLEKGGYGGKRPNCDSKNRAKTGEIPQNDGSEVGSAELVSEPLGYYSVIKMLGKAFREKMFSLSLSMTEKMSFMKEWLVLVSRAKTITRTAFLTTIPKDNERDMFELWSRIVLMKRMGKQPFLAEVELWEKLWAEGKLGDIKPPLEYECLF